MPVFPKHNLGAESAPWVRNMQSRVESLEEWRSRSDGANKNVRKNQSTSVDQLTDNYNALPITVSDSYTRYGGEFNLSLPTNTEVYEYLEFTAPLGKDTVSIIATAGEEHWLSTFDTDLHFFINISIASSRYPRDYTSPSVRSLIHEYPNGPFNLANQTVTTIAKFPIVVPGDKFIIKMGIQNPGPGSDFPTNDLNKRTLGYSASFYNAVPELG